MKIANLISVSLLALIVPAAALADCNQTPACQTSTPVINNDQYQNGNIYGHVQTLANYSEGAQLGSTAAGNALSARSVETGLNVYSLQRLDANVGAQNDITINEARGTTISNAIAQGNAGQVEACCSNLNVEAQQVALYGSNVEAFSNVNVGSSDTVISNAQTAANNWAIAAKNGYVESGIGQYNSAVVNSSSFVVACCNNGSITSSALATGNTNSIVGKNATIYSAVEQKNYGPISANAVILNNSATNNLASATAVANNANVTNEWGYAQLGGYQENNGNVDAHSLVLNEEFTGTAVSAASAMGNSALVSNIGSDGRLDMAQSNFGGGAISATANLVGSSSNGGVGMATSFAAGNTITGFACSSCAGGGVSMQGNSAQYNYAPVSASTNINVGSAGMIIGSATAIGNSATYIAQRAN